MSQNLSVPKFLSRANCLTSYCGPIAVTLLLKATLKPRWWWWWWWWWSRFNSALHSQKVY